MDLFVQNCFLCISGFGRLHFHFPLAVVFFGAGFDVFSPLVVQERVVSFPGIYKLSSFSPLTGFCLHTIVGRKDVLCDFCLLKFQACFVF
jgi:hypothetical protein